MRLALLSLIPLLSLTASASLSSNVINWAANAVSGDNSKIDDNVHVMDSWTWSDCGLPTDAIALQSITVKPDPPKPGANLTVTVDAIVNEIIEEGAYADVTVKLGLIKLLQKRFDVCEEARNANASVQCPVQPGPYSVSQTVELPEEIPKAKFIVNIRGYTAQDDDMVCLDLVVDFLRPHYS